VERRNSCLSFSKVLEPITILWPAFDHLIARPVPRSPVPPKIATVSLAFDPSDITYFSEIKSEIMPLLLLERKVRLREPIEFGWIHTYENWSDDRR